MIQPKYEIGQWVECDGVNMRVVGIQIYPHSMCYMCAWMWDSERRCDSFNEFELRGVNESDNKGGNMDSGNRQGAK